MIIFFLAVLAVIVVFGATKGVEHLLKGGKKTPVILKKPTLSKVGRVVYDEYMSLPADSRPFPDILEILHGLDKTTESPGRDNHFNDKHYANINQSVGYRFSWDGPLFQDSVCDHSKCLYAKYYSLHNSIVMVKKSLEEKQRAIALSTNAGSLDMIAELEQQLKSEANMNKNFVKEFKKLG